jgi:hypothetical protein
LIIQFGWQEKTEHEGYSKFKEIFIDDIYSEFPEEYTPPNINNGVRKFLSRHMPRLEFVEPVIETERQHFGKKLFDAVVEGRYSYFEEEDVQM